MPGSSGSTTAGARRTSTTTQGPVRLARLCSEDMATSDGRTVWTPTPLRHSGHLSRRRRPRVGPMGEIHVHEFMSLDGVIDAPVWTAEYRFDPAMGGVLGSGDPRAPPAPLAGPPG